MTTSTSAVDSSRWNSWMESEIKDLSERRSKNQAPSAEEDVSQEVQRPRQIAFNKMLSISASWPPDDPDASRSSPFLRSSILIKMANELYPRREKKMAARAMARF